MLSGAAMRYLAEHAKISTALALRVFQCMCPDTDYGWSGLLLAKISRGSGLSLPIAAGAEIAMVPPDKHPDVDLGATGDQDTR
jgi:hypothetical protein